MSSVINLHPAFWKALSAVLLLFILVNQFGSKPIRDHVWKSQSHSQTVPPSQESPSYYAAPPPPPPQQTHDTFVHHDAKPVPDSPSLWSYNTTRDHNHHGLSNEQCNIAFPDLYQEIDRAVLHWTGRPITSQSIELAKGNDGGVRILIHNQQVRIIYTRGMFREDFRHRIVAILNQLVRALTAAENANEPLPDMEFTIVVDDKAVQDKSEPGPLWTFARKFNDARHDSLWLIPDFHFFGAPPEAEGFRLQQEKCAAHDSELVDKIPKVVWRGVEWTNPEVRKPLLSVTQGKPWADVVAMDWDTKKDIIPMDAFCKFRYVVNTEGRAWSARMTHLLNCDSVLMVHDVEWIAHYYHLLDTGVNCVRVERDFSDLEQKVEYYNAHVQEAQSIADAGSRTFRERYTSPAATACYWRRLLRSWAESSFKPETHDPIDRTNDLQPSSRPRGISYEEFIVHDNTKDYPYKPN